MGAAREPDERGKAMRRIEDEAARMGVLVEDLLTLARLDEVARRAARPVDLAALAADAVDDARATAPDREIGLRDDGPAPVLGDADQLRQVLANLLRNALVHTPAGTPIEVSVRARADGVRVEVRDHGPGLPTDDPDALFERFWRAEGGRERGKGGAGLGLAIVAGIVDAHGGTGHAANAAGRRGALRGDPAGMPAEAGRRRRAPDRRRGLQRSLRARTVTVPPQDGSRGPEHGPSGREKRPIGAKPWRSSSARKPFGSIGTRSLSKTASRAFAASGGASVSRSGSARRRPRA